MVKQLDLNYFAGGRRLTQRTGLVAELNAIRNELAAEVAAVRSEFDPLNDAKASVRLASTANIANLAAPGANLDGVALVEDDRVLLKNQTSAAENGLYVVGASGALTRALDADGDDEVTAGLSVYVAEGDTLAETTWRLTTPDPILVGTTELTFAASMSTLDKAIVDRMLVDRTATVSGKLILLEGTDNGTNKATVKTADSLAGDVTVLLDASASLLAMLAEDTDGEIEVPFTTGVKEGGTWTAAVTAAGGPTLRRSAADAADAWWAPILVPNRTAASRGVKPLTLEVNYNVDTADLADVRFEVWKQTMGADGAAPTFAVLGGDADGHYDAAHDTALKRGDDTGAPELHRAVVTLPTPAYLAADELLFLRVYCDGDAGPAGILTVTAVKLGYAQRLLDAA